MSSVECNFAKNKVDFGYAKLVDKHISKYEQIFDKNERNLNQYKPTDDVITITDNNNSGEQSEEPNQPQTAINNNNNDIYTNLYKVKSTHKYACNWCDCAYETSSHSAIIKHLRNDHTVSQMLPNCSRSDDNDSAGQSTSESLSARKIDQKEKKRLLERRKKSEKSQNENSGKDKTWQQNYREVLDYIFNFEDSAPFRSPVDPIQYPDYSQIIDTPMDLTTVKEQLLADLYENSDEFCNDVRLIFSNSKKFNTNRRSRIYSMTLRLSRVFEEKIQNMSNCTTINYKQRNQRPRHLSGRERYYRRRRHRYSIIDYENAEDFSDDTDSDYNGDQKSFDTSSVTTDSEMRDEHNNDNDSIEVRRSQRKSRKKVNFSFESEIEDLDCYTWYTPRSSTSKYKKRSNVYYNDKDYNYNDNKREKVRDCYDDNVTTGHSTGELFNDKKIGRNETKRLSDSVCRQPLEEKYNSIKELPERYRPPEWLTDTYSRKTPYFAQIGDEVVYFRRGHQQYIDTVRENDIYDINPNLKPHKLRNSSSDEIFARIIGIKFLPLGTKPIRLMTLRLNIIDTHTGEQTNTQFSVCYHNVESVANFIILKQLYNKSIACDWKVGDEFRSIIDSKWWFGTITCVRLSESSPVTHFHCFDIFWSNGDSESLSPWDLERIDEQTVPQDRIESVSVTRDEMNAYNVCDEHEWPECGKVEECRRISQGLEKIMGLSEAQEFAVAVDLNAHPVYGMMIAYPMDLSTIKSRVDNHYYRRVDAIKHDIKFIESNARQYNVTNYEIVKYAKLVRELCLRFIEDQHFYDPMIIYLRITSRIEEPDSKDTAAAGTSTSHSLSGQNEKKRLLDSNLWQQLEEKYNYIKKLPERYRPPEWFTGTRYRKTPYFAQIGDEVVYFRRGHQQYIDFVRDNDIYDINPNLKPHKLRNSVSDEIFAKIVDIKYDVKPTRLVTLRLNIIDPDSGIEQTNSHFSVCYHEVENVVDFILLKQLYDKTIACDWKVGDEFRSIMGCLVEDRWWFGTIMAVSVRETSPFSHFQCFEVVWANGETESLSPWDLERINEQTVPQDRIESVSVTRDEMNAYNVCDEHEWPECGKVEECRRISQGLIVIMQLSEAKPFSSAVDLNAHPVYGMMIAYPMDLSTIKSRVDNHYYRRVDAIKHDIKFIESNACEFNEAYSEIVTDAKLVCELCFRFIEDQQCNDPMIFYIDIIARIDESRKHKTWQQNCRELLDCIFISEDSAPFRSPVDPIEYPDYSQVIDTPMDLTTVKVKLLADSYENADEFCKDMRLIFSNSKRFNTNKRSRIYSMTRRLSDLFENKFRNIMLSFSFDA